MIAFDQYTLCIYTHLKDSNQYICLHIKITIRSIYTYIDLYKLPIIISLWLPTDLLPRYKSRHINRGPQCPMPIPFCYRGRHGLPV